MMATRLCHLCFPLSLNPRFWLLLHLGQISILLRAFPTWMHRRIALRAPVKAFHLGYALLPRCKLPTGGVSIAPWEALLTCASFPSAFLSSCPLLCILLAFSIVSTSLPPISPFLPAIVGVGAFVPLSDSRTGEIADSPPCKELKLTAPPESSVYHDFCVLVETFWWGFSGANVHHDFWARSVGLGRPGNKCQAVG